VRLRVPIAMGTCRCDALLLSARHAWGKEICSQSMSLFRVPYSQSRKFKTHLNDYLL